MGRRAVRQRQRAALRAAGGGWQAAGGGWRGAGGMRQAAGGGSNDGEGNAQVAAACGDVRLFCSCVDTAMLFDIRYLTLLFLCRGEHLKRQEKKTRFKDDFWLI